MDELTRFAQRLVEQLASNGGAVHRAVSIGDLRETILPYRNHRKALGLTSVEDYETVLLRLVAGEGGYAKASPAAAAERCREVLAGTNPDLGVLDEVSDSTIQVTSIAAGRIVADEGAHTTPAEPVPAPAAPPAEVDPPARIGKRHPPRNESQVEAAPPPVIASEAKRSEIASTPKAPRNDTAPVIPSTAKGSSPMSDACAHCSKPIPKGRQVVFCPWCGERLIPFTCTRCGTELDSEWQHCITCGAPAKDPYKFT